MIGPFTLPLIVALIINNMSPGYRAMPTEFEDSSMSASRHGIASYARSADCREGISVLQYNVAKGAKAARQAKDIWTLHAANCDPGYYFGNYSKMDAENYCLHLRTEYAFRESLELSSGQISLNQAMFHWMKCELYNQ